MQGHPDMEVEGKFLKIGFPKFANFDGGFYNPAEVLCGHYFKPWRAKNF